MYGRGAPVTTSASGWNVGGNAGMYEDEALALPRMGGLGGGETRTGSWASFDTKVHSSSTGDAFMSSSLSGSGFASGSNSASRSNSGFIENPNTSLPALPPMPTSPIAVGTSTSSDPFLDSSPLTGRPRSVVRRKSVNYNPGSSNPNSSSELVAPLPVSSTSVNSITPVLPAATRRVRTEAGLSMDSSNSASASDSNSSGDHHPASALPSMPEDINVPSDFTPQPANRNSYPYGGGGYASNTYPMSHSNSQSNVAAQSRRISLSSQSIHSSNPNLNPSAARSRSRNSAYSSSPFNEFGAERPRGAPHLPHVRAGVEIVLPAPLAPRVFREEMAGRERAEAARLQERQRIWEAEQQQREREEWEAHGREGEERSVEGEGRDGEREEAMEVPRRVGTLSSASRGSGGPSAWRSTDAAQQ